MSIHASEAVQSVSGIQDLASFSLHPGLPSQAIDIHERRVARHLKLELKLEPLHQDVRALGCSSQSDKSSERDVHFSDPDQHDSTSEIWRRRPLQATRYDGRLRKQREQVRRHHR
jgi:hypothetical protein